MEVLTSQLAGAALNWAVAEAEGLNIRIALPNPEHHVIRVIRGDNPNQSYSPTTDWNISVPILNSEKISTIASEGSGWFAMCGGLTRIAPFGEVGMRPHFKGKDLIEAGLRCYVSKKLGDTVEIPDELVYSLESPIHKY